MQCNTIKNGVECSFMSKCGCSYNGGACNEIVEKCNDCDRISKINDKKYCAVFPDPAVKWRIGDCSMATHIKNESKNDSGKLRVGQQKQKKK